MASDNSSRRTRHRAGQPVSAVSRSLYNGSYEPDTSQRRRRRRRRVGIAILVVLLLLVGSGVAFGVTFYKSAMTVKTNATVVIDDGEELKEQIKSGDLEGAQLTAERVARLSQEMDEETSGTLWDVASGLPVVGGDIQKVRALVKVLSDLSENAITPLTNTLSGFSLSSLMGDDGTVNVDALSTLVDAVNQAQPVFERCAQAVNEMGDAELEQVNGPLVKAREKLNSLNEKVTLLAQVASQLPDMLGASGPRTYLLIAQNNSEIRSTGGFPGSRGLITVDNGRIGVGDFEDVGEHFDESDPLPLTDEETNVLVNIMGTYANVAPGDVNASPSFPRAAQLMQEAWSRQNDGMTVDGVVAFDPVFLQSLLALTGGITTSNGTVVDGSNAAQVLLNQTYFLDPDLQDPFFNEVASLAMDHILHSLGSCSMGDLVKTVKAGMENHRALAYMNDEEEQQAMVLLGCDGEVSQDATEPVVGFYLYDRTGSKLDWYLDFRTQVGEAVTNADGSTSYAVTTTLHNTTTAEQMLELPSYITGTTPEVHNYSMVTCFIIMAPEGGTITDLAIDADKVHTHTEATLYGHDVWAGFIQTYPSATSTFTYTVTTSPEATEPLEVWMTPTGQTFS